jgi:hypothetical protein
MAAARMLSLALCSALVLGAAARVHPDLVGGKQVTVFCVSGSLSATLDLWDRALPQVAVRPCLCQHGHNDARTIYQLGGTGSTSCRRRTSLPSLPASFHF